MFVNMYATNSIKIKCFLMAAVALGSCQPDNRKALAESVSQLIHPDSTNEIVVVIPNQGCQGCISEAEKFVLNNYNKLDNVNYIFTQIHSVKLLKLRLGDSVIFSPKVKLDVKNEISYPEKAKEIYPMIVYYQDAEIKKIDYQSPQSEGFKNLLNHEKPK